MSTPSHDTITDRPVLFLAQLPRPCAQAGYRITQLKTGLLFLSHQVGDRVCVLLWDGKTCGPETSSHPKLTFTSVAGLVAALDQAPLGGVLGTVCINDSGHALVRAQREVTRQDVGRSIEIDLDAVIKHENCVICGGGVAGGRHVPHDPAVVLPDGMVLSCQVATGPQPNHPAQTHSPPAVARNLGDVPVAVGVRELQGMPSYERSAAASAQAAHQLWHAGVIELGRN